MQEEELRRVDGPLPFQFDFEEEVDEAEKKSFLAALKAGCAAKQPKKRVRCVLVSVSLDPS